LQRLQKNLRRQNIVSVAEITIFCGKALRGKRFGDKTDLIPEFPPWCSREYTNSGPALLISRDSPQKAILSAAINTKKG
jgi:hypothetical protein